MERNIRFGLYPSRINHTTRKLNQNLPQAPIAR